MQDRINQLRTNLLSSLFPEEVVVAVVKAANDFNNEQFSGLYKFLLTERIALIKMFEEGLEQDQPEEKNGADLTMQILKAKYGVTK